MHVGQAGIVLNLDKFQFAQREENFAGFRVSETTIEPLPKYLNAIRDFPSPTSITDISSWFGLVTQVANYAQICDIMAPCKPFLSPRCQFMWSADMEEAFLASKKGIVQAILKRCGDIRCAETHLLLPRLVKTWHWVLLTSAAL